jgi:hypothetical protein
MNRQQKQIELILAIMIVLLTAAISIAVYMRYMTTSFFMGPFRFGHWLTIVGTLYIAVATPIFAVLKRYYPSKISSLYSFHMFGNLAFFSLISIHFAAQISRPVAPELGTGLVLLVAMLLQVVSGFVLMFGSHQLGKGYRKGWFLHASLIAVFYVAIIIHSLHGFGAI